MYGMADDALEISEITKKIRQADNKINNIGVFFNTSEATLHVINVACGIAGTYWGIKALIEESKKEKVDSGEITVSVMGGLISGFGSAASGILGLGRMIKKSIIDHQNKNN